MHLLPPTLARLADVADKHDSTRFTLSNVRLELKPDGSFVADATDSKRLIRVTGPGVDRDTIAREYPTFPAIESAPNGATAALVPAAAWRKAFAAAEKHTRKVKKRPVLQTVAVVAGDRVTTFGATDGAAPMCETVPNGEGRFPPVPDILRQGKRARQLFTVDAALLADQLRAFADVCGGDVAPVTFSHEKQGRTVFLRAATGSLAVDGVIMPLSPGDEVAPADMETGVTPDELAELRATLADAETRADRFRVERDAALKREEEYARIARAVTQERNELRDQLAGLRGELACPRGPGEVPPVAPADPSELETALARARAELAARESDLADTRARLDAVSRDLVVVEANTRGIVEDRDRLQVELSRVVNRPAAEGPVPPAPVAPAVAVTPVAPAARPLTRAERVALIRAARGAAPAAV